MTRDDLHLIEGQPQPAPIPLDEAIAHARDAIRLLTRTLVNDKEAFRVLCDAAYELQHRQEQIQATERARREASRGRLRAFAARHKSRREVPHA